MLNFEGLTDVGRARRLRATVRRALASYGIKATTIRQLAVDTNYVFKVTTTDGRGYAMKVLRQGLRDPLDTHLECWWVDQLAQCGVPVAAVVANRRGEFVTTVDGIVGVPDGQRCVLFRWLPGRSGDDGPLQVWEGIGRLMALMHEAAASMALPEWARPRRWDRVFLYGSPVLWDPAYASGTTETERTILAEAVAQLDPLLVADNDRHGRLRLLHGDLGESNVIVYRGSISAIDFEDVILGSPVDDIAVTLYDISDREDYASVMTTFRRGYESIRAWPLDDLDQMHTRFAARAVLLADYCVLMGPSLHHYVPGLVDQVQHFLTTPSTRH